MLKDKNGCEFRVGDVLAWATDALPGPNPERTIARINTESIYQIDCNGRPDGRLHHDKHWVIRRADGSAPSPHAAPSPPATDERPILGKDRDGRDVRKGDKLRDVVSDFLLDVDRWDGFLFLGSDANHPEDRFCCITGTDAVLATAAPQAEPLRNFTRPVTSAPFVSGKVEPETFAVCGQCGERQPGAECQMPACRQIRKHVAERKLDERGRRIPDLDEGTDIMPDCAELRSLTGYDAVDIYGDGAPPWASVPLRDVLVTVLVVNGKPSALRISRREVAAAGGELGPSMPTRRRNAEALRSVIIRKAKAMGAKR